MSEPIDRSATRDEHGRFTGGHASANPTGRPLGFRGLARKISRETRGGDELVEYALEVLRDTKAETRDRMAALAWLSDRGFGRPLQSVELLADVGVTPQLDAARVLARLDTTTLRALADAAAAGGDASPALPDGETDG